MYLSENNILTNLSIGKSQCSFRALLDLDILKTVTEVFKNTLLEFGYIDKWLRSLEE